MARLVQPKIIQPCVNVANGTRTQTGVGLLTAQDLFDVPGLIVIDAEQTISSNVVLLAGYQAVYSVGALVAPSPALQFVRLRMLTVNPETMAPYDPTGATESGLIIDDLTTTAPSFGFMSNEQNSVGPPVRSPKTWGYVVFTLENSDTGDAQTVTFLNLQFDSR